MLPEMSGESSKGFSRAQIVVGGGPVADLLAPDSILLVSEHERSVSERCVRHVIQRRVRSLVDLAVSCEGDVAETEGLGAAFASALEVLRRSEEPEEGNNGEVDGVFVGLAMDGVFSVEGSVEPSEDGDIGWVSSCLRVVLVAERLEESRE